MPTTLTAVESNANRRARLVTLLTAYNTRPQYIVDGINALIAAGALTAIAPTTFGLLASPAGTSTASITTGTAALTSADNVFSVLDVGKTIHVAGAGVAGATLLTTIAAYVSVTAVTLTAAASTTISATTISAAGVAVWGTPAPNAITGVVTSPDGLTTFQPGTLDLSNLAAATMIAGGSTSRNLAVRFTELVNVKDFGAIGDGVANDTASIAAALTFAVSGNTVYLPPGSYLITSTNTLKNGVNILGENAKIVFNPNTIAGQAKVFTSADLSDCTIKGITFIANTAISTPAPNAAIVLTKATRVNVWNCISSSVNLFSIPNSRSYATVDADIASGSFNASRFVDVANCLILGPSATDQTFGGGIEICYCVDWSVSDCKIFNGGAGMFFWGGDANVAVNGALANDRKNKRGTVTGVTVEQSGSGIWGSMGENINITGCALNRINDVGYDFEGCFDCQAGSSTAKDCFNGCMATFSCAKNIIFKGICVSSTLASYVLLTLRNNTGVEANSTGIIVDGCTFNGAPTTTPTAVNTAGSTNVAFENNTLNNCYLDFSNTLHGRIGVINNYFGYDQNMTAAFKCLYVNGGQNGKNVEVSGNRFFSSAAQNAGTSAINVLIDNYNFSPLVAIAGNRIVSNSFAGGEVNIVNNGTNGGNFGRFIITGNTFYSGIFNRTETGAAISSCRLEWNSLNLGGRYPNAIPGAGRWDAGQHVWFNAPAAGAAPGAVCTTAGTPGTWKNFATIAP